jgi:hypothetical protein
MRFDSGVQKYSNKHQFDHNYSGLQDFFLLLWLYKFAKIYQIQLQVKVFEIWNPPRRSELQNSELAQKEKIWCASRTRVNLQHIGNSKCIKFVLQLKVYPFLVEMPSDVF